MASDNEELNYNFGSPLNSFEVLDLPEDENETRDDVTVRAPALPGEEGSIIDCHRLILPQPINIHLSTSDLYKMKFIYQSDTNRHKFKSYMASHNTTVECEFESQTVRLICNVASGTDDVVSRVQDWLSMHDQRLSEFLDALMIATIDASQPEIMNTVLTTVKIINKEKVAIFLSTSGSSVTVVGSDRQQFKQVSESIKEATEIQGRELQRQQEEITHTMELKYDLSIIQQFGLIEMTTLKHPEVNIAYKPPGNWVELKGKLYQVHLAKDYLLMIVNTLPSETHHDVPVEQLKLLVTDEVTEYIINNKFNGQKNIASWYANLELKSITIIAKDEWALSNSKSCIMNSVCHQVLILDPDVLHLLEDLQWKDFITDIYAKHPNMVRIYTIGQKAPKLYITAVKEFLTEVETSVLGFFQKNASFSLQISFGSFRDRLMKKYFENECSDEEVRATMTDEDGLSIIGKKDLVDKCASRLNKRNYKIFCREERIRIASYCTFLDSDKAKEVISHIETTSRCLVDIQTTFIQSSEENIFVSGEFQQKNTDIHVLPGDVTQKVDDAMINPTNSLSINTEGVAKEKEGCVKPVIISGDIAMAKADVIVNAVSRDLKLQSGAISSSIYKVGGATLQEECKKQHPKGITAGDIVETGGGGLSCKKVYHTNPGDYKQDKDGQKLKQLIKECIERCEKSNYSSIAIPVIGTGKLAYPRDLVARIFYVALSEYKQQGGRLSMKNIQIVIFPGDKAVIQAFNKEERKQDEYNKILWKPKLLVNKIEKSKTDVIVNSVSRDLKLQSGAVSSSIYKVGGATLQEECKKQHPKGITAGDIVETGGGGLSCKKVYHTNPGGYKQDRDGQKTKQLILKCLRQCEASQYKSITFPAIGTGALGYPRDLVADLFYQAINEYKSQRGCLNVEDIHIVVDVDDHQCRQVFKETDVRIQTSTLPTPVGGRNEAKENVLKGGSVAKLEGVKGGRDAKEGKVLKGGTAAKAKKEDGYLVTMKELNQGIHVGDFILSINTNGKQQDGIACMIVETDLTKAVINPEIDTRILTDGIATSEIAREVNSSHTYLIYVDTERFKYNIEGAVEKCLQEAEQRHITSISLPLDCFSYGASDKNTFELAKILFCVLNRPRPCEHVKYVTVVTDNQAPLSSFLNGINDCLRQKHKQLENDILLKEEFDRKVEEIQLVSLPSLTPTITEHKILYFYSDDKRAIDAAMTSLDEAHCKN